MPKIVVPKSIQNEAFKIASSIAGVATFGLGAKVISDHHDEIKRQLKAKGHAHKELQHHEAVPQDHVVLHTT